MGVVIGREVVGQLFDQLRQKKQIVFTNGCFDLLHIGHVRYLQEAKKLGDLLVVGVNSDASVKRLKGEQRPVQSEDDRAEILSALLCVDYSIIFPEDTPLELIQLIKPHVLVKGGDWKPEAIVGSDVVLASGGRVLSLNFVDGRSTTQIISKIEKN